MFTDLNEKLNITNEQIGRLSREMRTTKCFWNGKIQYMKLKIHQLGLIIN